MAVAAALLANTNATTAAIRALVQLFVDAATAGGLIQTADTGQTAANAFPTPAGTGTSAGYQVWRFADALQATKPVFCKIEWGMSNAGSNGMAVWFTIGTGSDGAGNITGTLLARTSVMSVAIAGGVLQNIMSVGTARIMMIYGIGYATQNNCIFASVERSKDSAGADTGDGIMWFSTAAAGANWVAQYIPFTGVVRAAQQYITVPVPGTQTTFSNGQSIGLTPVLPFAQDGAKCAGLNLLVYNTGDLARANTITVTVYGASHTYYVVGSPQGWAAAASALLSVSSIAVLYE